ncbi:MAG: hypothetical protein IIX32_08365, partial [Alistipes sp.]|nr:hypothetical protein [Alistipes sp.]
MLHEVLQLQGSALGYALLDECIIERTRAIFGDKAGDVKDASLKAQPSLHGVVIDTKLYSH